MTVPGEHPLRLARVITRLNIGDPAIQAITLSDRLRSHGIETLLIHGRLGAAEGDMSEMLDPSIDARYLPTLCRPISPVDDIRAIVTIFSSLREYCPATVHTHMAKAGALTRVAACLYNLTAVRGAPARVVHTYHGHVLEGTSIPDRPMCSSCSNGSWRAGPTRSSPSRRPSATNCSASTALVARRR